MPNHVTNKLVFIAKNYSDIKKMFDNILGIYIDPDDNSRDERIIDFNKIIPEPQEVIDSYDDTRGNPLWYTWRLENWDTKWNSYTNKKIDDYTITFLTAWSPPITVIEKLAEMYPEISIIHTYYDEDIGNRNIGEFVYENGELQKETHPIPMSKEAIELIISISPEYEELLQYNNETKKYEWKEDEE